MNMHNAHLFFAIKIVRVFNGIQIFKVSFFINSVKDLVKENNMKKIKHDPRIAEDVINDHTMIGPIIITGFILRTLELTMIILNIVYFVGMFWISFCRVT